MKVITAEHFGICFGVRDAIAQAQALAREAPLTILGELVHNPIVREQLRAQGVHEEPSDRAPQTSRVMFTAHGASDKRREALSKSGLVVADGTCPLVRYAHEQLKRLVQAGYFPVVIGLANHVEVRGLVGDFADAFVINESADIQNLPAQPRYGIISQTTQPIDRVRALVAEIARANPGAEIRFADTVCKPTKDRQLALKKLIEVAEVIVVVVVGGRQSNNTRQLVETCRAAGKRALHIERPEELQPEWFRGVRVVGLTGGTSTLPETVEAVRQRLEEFHD
ncbi:MAG: 4-hydroxy-3-methylbut-2-enyl diphosphate reductase [Verrucomicrobia bacterium]|nr:MAG: 4-hydroxy-3-methylbut-2-enyl diphosphate reductase [Verrucomicrobiota bacterium]PYM09582.1 MAG: 4-hydroxy-3-methylbut-2-enyl diphosphate reductase [Verrucomicrobiota bacterium]